MNKHLPHFFAQKIQKQIDVKNKKYKNKKVGFQNCLYLFQFHKKNFLLDPATNSETTNAELLKVFFS